MSYTRYGISPELVQRVKRKMKNPAVSDRVKTTLNGITKSDLQSRIKIKNKLKVLSKILGEPLSEQDTANIVSFILDMKIDPNNALHLIRLWHMFR